MKNNVTEVQYKDNTTPQKGSGWWTWDETCDRCGKIIRKYGEWQMGYPKSQGVDITEEDLCLDCLRYLLDERKKSRE